MAPAVVQFKSRRRQEVQVEAEPVELRHLWRGRVAHLKPIIWKELQSRYSDAEYFTRDHILYFRIMRQFSVAYRISLVRRVVGELIEEIRLLELSRTDLVVNTPENMRRYRALQRDPNSASAYSGSYTTRSADELLNRRISKTRLDRDFLSGWLQCLSHLSDITRYQYACRIVDDLVRRGVLYDNQDGTFSVVYE
jgi:hypothetical protein